MKQILLLYIGILFFTIPGQSQDELYTGDSGIISFHSEAPLELISAESRALRGIINPETKSFAFSVNINTFQGFNSDIQRTHFLENYMEHKRYPQATFTGKIIEDIPFDTPGTYIVRAKGELEIHGIKKERIIKGTITINNDGAHMETSFTVPVMDHGISIPKIVKQKIAEQISVNIDIEFDQRSKS